MLRVLNVVAVAAILVAALVTGFLLDRGGDFYWHLVLGDWMLEHLKIFRLDTFSYTFAGKPMFITEWLGAVFLAAAHKLGGYPGCLVLRAVTLVALFSLLLVDMVKRGLSAWAASVLLWVFLGVSHFFFSLRPETFSFVGLAAVSLLMAEYERSRNKRLLVYYLGVLFVWAHVHASVSVGLFVSGCFFLENAVRNFNKDRRELLLSLAMPLIALAVTSIHPEGIRLPLSVLLVAREEGCINRFGENQSMSVNEFQPLEFADGPAILRFALAGMAATSLLSLRKASPWLAAASLVFSVAAFKYQRLVSTAFVIALPFAASNLAHLSAELRGMPREQLWRRVGQVVAVLLVAWSLWAMNENKFFSKITLKENEKQIPRAACAFAQKAKLTGNVLNSYNVSGYLMYCLPEHPVAIDQRACTLYSGAFNLEYEKAWRDEATLRALADRYGATWTFTEFDHYAAMLSQHPDKWRLLYFDEVSAIYARTDDTRNQAQLDKGFQILNPSRLEPLINLPADKLDAARAELALQRERCPTCYTNNLFEVALAISTRDPKQMDAAFRGLTKPEPRGMRLRGHYLLSIGKYREAAQAYVNSIAYGGPPEAAIVSAAAAHQLGGDIQEARNLLVQGTNLFPKADALRVALQKLDQGQPVAAPQNK